jgi:hypothetical protein
MANADAIPKGIVMKSDQIKAKYKVQLNEENALLLSILDGTSHETGEAFSARWSKNWPRC